MSLFPDETLMAYADGELSPEESRRLEAELANNPALRARLEPFAVTGATLASVFDRPMREPVPERLLAVVDGAGPKIRAAIASRRGMEAAAKSAERRRSGFLDALGRTLFPGGFQLAGAFSVAVLLAAGGAAGWMLAQSQHGSGGTLVAFRALQGALETMPSGAPRAEAGTAWVVPVQTFVSRDQRYCRQYELASAAGRSYLGVACRSQDGVWTIAFHAELKGGKATTGGYRTAARANSGRPQGEPDPVSKALDSAVDDMKSGDVLGAEAETALIAKGWDAGK
jgi:surface antigen